MHPRSHFLLACAAIAAAKIPAFAQAVDYHLEKVTLSGSSVFNQPTYLTQAPNDPSNILYYSQRITSANSGFGATNSMGQIFRYDSTTRTSSVVLDLSSRTITNDDGLQTFTFNPDFNNPGTSGYGKIYVASATQGATSLDRVEQYTLLNANGTFKTPAQVAAETTSNGYQLILQYSNSAQNNHTVDWVGFDPNATGAARNYLYISAGDGSYGNNYNGASAVNGRPSQNPSDVKGKILRVDINPADGDAYPNDPNKNFAIPASNPIPVYNAAHPGSPILGPGGTAAAGEVFVTGVRNPYRVSFDTANSNLYWGDVGENAWEEVDFLKNGSNIGVTPPADFGWPQIEGTYNSPVPGAPHTTNNPFTGATPLYPLQEFPHTASGNAVIGGYVYHGPVTSLQGKYFYADYVTGRVWSLDFDPNTDPSTFNANNGTATQIDPLWNALIIDPNDPTYHSDVSLGSLNGIDHVVSFAQDNAGNLYVIDLGYGTTFDGQYTASAGEIFKVVPGALSVPATAVWTGGLGTSWSAASGTTTNFNTDRTSNINTNQSPGYATDVVFATTTPGAVNFNTTLGRDFFIDSLSVKSGSPAVIIGNGTSGANTLVILGTPGISVEAGSGGLTINSGLEVGANQTWTNNAAIPLIINGAVTGPGGVTLRGTLTLGAAAAVTLNGGLTFAPSAASRFQLNGPSTTSNTVSVGILTGDITAVIENSTASAAANILEINSPGVSTFSGLIRNGTTGTVALRMNGGGTQTLSGPVSATGGLVVRAGKMILSGTMPTFTATAGAITVGDTASQNAVLEVDGAAISSSSGTAGVQIGTTTSLGALILNSGSITTTNELWIATANGGYGAMVMNGGSVTTGSWLAVARGGGSAILNVNGGTLNVNGNPLTVGSTGGGASTLHAAATFTGGTTNVARTLFVSEQTSAIVTLSNNAIVNVNGTTASNGGIGLSFTGANATTGAAGILNLNGGSLTTTRVMEGGTASGTTGTFNFNGGILRAASGTTFAANFFTGVTNTYIFPGGGSIDDNNQNITIAEPLQAPSGNGVSSITVDSGALFFAPPLVTLSGGGGVGATAIANIDTSGNLTGITVTNPGIGYSSSPAITLSGGGGFVNSTASTITLASNVAGGFTKLGTGTLNLTSLVTYGGPLSINAGLLVFNTSSATPNLVGPVSGAGKLQINGGTTLTSGGVQTTGSWTINGTHNIAPALGDAGTSKVNAIPIIAHTGSGTSATYTATLNLSDSKLIVQTTGAADKSAKITSLTEAISVASAGGTWTGNGLTSSSAAADSSHYGLGLFDNALLGLPTFGGQAVDSESILVAVAHLGDANRNGIVDIQDLTIVANNWQKPANNWAQGDLNRDGIVDIQDFTIVANNWQQSSSFALQNGAVVITSSPVPEPASLALIALVAPLLLKRRRRN